MIGQTLGHYRVESELGAGGMGVVYRAHDTKLGRTVAIKLVGDRFSTDPSARDRLLREARTASSLNHPHICTIHEVGENDGQVYIVMEHVEGRPLSALLSEPRPIETVVRYGIQIADALAHAHERRIVHRDLKTGNVIVTPEGRVKILDFGLAKRLPGEDLTEDITRSGDSLTEAGQVVGTLHYLAPEVLRGKTADARTDIWALGVLLYELVTGDLPFRRKSRFEITAAILEQPPKPLPAKIPTGLRAMIERCLAKDPAQRYQRASEARSALEAIQAGAFVVQQPPPRSRISRRWLLILGAAAATIAGLVGWQVLTPGRGGIDSIAVLPFIIADGNPDMEYLSDGVTENVIGSLSRVPKLKVIAFASVLRYKGKAVDPQQVVQDLGVRATVMGRMTKRGDRVSITAELIDTQDKSRLWGDQYDVKAEEILKIQEEIARRVSDQLRHLSDEEKRLITRRYTEDAEAYDLYLKGRYYHARDTLEDYRRSLDFFQRAVEKDPNYAPAYVGVAWVYGAFIADGFMQPREAYEQMEGALRKAQKLDDTLGTLQYLLGTIKANRDWDWEGADKHNRSAVALDPQNADIHGGISKGLRARGLWEEAIKEGRLAQALDPLGLETNKSLAYTYYYARRYDDAIALAQKTLEIDPKHWPTHELLSDVYGRKGMYEESIRALQQSLRESGDTEGAEALGDDFKNLGFERVMRQLHQSTLEFLKEERKTRYVSPMALAAAYANLGEKDQAFARLEEALNERVPIAALKTYFEFDNLRSDPRFTELLKRTGLS